MTTRWRPIHWVWGTWKSSRRAITLCVSMSVSQGWDVSYLQEYHRNVVNIYTKSSKPLRHSSSTGSLSFVGRFFLIDTHSISMSNMFSSRYSWNTADVTLNLDSLTHSLALKFWIYYLTFSTHWLTITRLWDTMDTMCQPSQCTWSSHLEVVCYDKHGVLKIKSNTEFHGFKRKVCSLSGIRVKYCVNHQQSPCSTVEFHNDVKCLTWISQTLRNEFPCQ